MSLYGSSLQLRVIQELSTGLPFSSRTDSITDVMVVIAVCGQPFLQIATNLYF